MSKEEVEKMFREYDADFAASIEHLNGEVKGIKEVLGTTFSIIKSLHEDNDRLMKCVEILSEQNKMLNEKIDSIVKED